MIINKKWHANSSRWIAWTSPVADGPDTTGAHYELGTPPFGELSGDLIVSDSDFEGGDVDSEVQYAVAPSSLWQYNWSLDLEQSQLLEGHTGLWAICLDDTFDLTPSSVNMVDKFWFWDENGDLMPVGEGDDFFEG